MKVLKRAEQKNFTLNTEMYTWHDICGLLGAHFICYFDDDFNQVYEFSAFHWNEKDYRVFAEDIDEIKVVYNKEYGFYETVAVMKHGTTLHITL